MDMDKARKAVALENQIQEAVKIINKASSELQTIGMDIRLIGWNWDKSGYTAKIMAQNNLEAKILPISERPS